jgi:hypothetical protein
MSRYKSKNLLKMKQAKKLESLKCEMFALKNGKNIKGGQPMGGKCLEWVESKKKNMLIVD